MLDNIYCLSYIRYTRRLQVTVITRLLGHSDYFLPVLVLMTGIDPGI
jgi:hypothetical protein